MSVLLVLENVHNLYTAHIHTWSVRVYVCVCVNNITLYLYHFHHYYHYYHYHYYHYYYYHYYYYYYYNYYYHYLGRHLSSAPNRPTNSSTVTYKKKISYRPLSPL